MFRYNNNKPIYVYGYKHYNIKIIIIMIIVMIIDYITLSAEAMTRLPPRAAVGQ